LLFLHRHGLYSCKRWVAQRLKRVAIWD
jgi:hypothetical protein